MDGYGGGGGGGGGLLVAQIWTSGTVPACDVMLKTVGMGWQWAAGGMDLDFGHSARL